MNSKILYGKENNIFQSADWQEFQESFGRKTEQASDTFGVNLALPLGQNFVWVSKGPEKLNQGFLSEAKKLNATFVRLEPGDLGTFEGKLKQVTKKSLLSGQASPKATRILDLTKSEDEILAQMKPKTRYNIRLAEKKEVVVKKTNDAGVLYDMLVSTSGKGTGFFPHEKDYYVKMMEALGAKDLAAIFVAEHEGEPLAAILVTFYGKVATYLHGGQSDAKKNLMAPYLCQWAAIKEAKSRGCALYDFWGVAETDDPTDSWAGITRFKEGFGGEKVTFPGSFDLVLRPFWYNVLTLAAKFRHLVRK